jgi:hypothetical protein
MVVERLNAETNPGGQYRMSRDKAGQGEKGERGERLGIQYTERMSRDKTGQGEKREWERGRVVIIWRG